MAIVLTPRKISEKHLTSQEGDQIAAKEGSVFQAFFVAKHWESLNEAAALTAQKKLACLDVRTVCPGDPVFPK